MLKRTRDLFPKLGAEYHVSTSTWNFPNGATLKLRHLWDETDTEEYQGHEYSFMVFEEATNWPTPEPINKMRATLRNTRGVPVTLLLTANPGGPGHNWVKQRYVQPNRLGYEIIDDPDSGTKRVFIPAKLDDNPALTTQDPTYKDRLRLSGPEALVRAWLHGDWDIVAGGFFDDVFRADRHVLRPFSLPREWQIVVGFDWGSSAPASLGIFARVTNSYPYGADLPRFFPRGSLIRFKEWYTVRRDERGELKPNVGIKLSNRDLGAGIARRLKSLKTPRVLVADPAIFTKYGQQSIHEEMREGAREEGYNLTFSPADNNRLTGWQRMRDLLEESAKERAERPGLWVFDNCEHWLRTVPVLQSDPKEPDDVDTDTEDHAADDTRYVAMARDRRVIQTRFSGY